MTPERRDNTELAGLPAWLYPLGFWIGAALLAVGVLFPAFALVGVGWVALVPVFAAVWVAVGAWKRDRRLSLGALAALAGLGIVFLVKGLI